VLLNQLKPAECSRAPLQETDLHQRAEKVCGGSSFGDLLRMGYLGLA
jgi:hypothetical protein